MELTQERIEGWLKIANIRGTQGQRFRGIRFDDNEVPYFVFLDEKAKQVVLVEVTPEREDAMAVA